MSDVQIEPSKNDIKLVIAASSAGTIFEWYDFFIYGTLASIIGPVFFPGDNAILSTLLVWATFAIGFGFRPIGAILFGYLGDKLGRKYTFLVTVTLMGIATAGVGMLPSAATIGVAAPIIIILLRILQGLALGGEYGGAAIYVAEHADDDKRGYYTSFIQASVVGGFVLSLIVVLSTKYLLPKEVFEAWGWRVPFLLSILLLGISLWMRLKLSESPVFQAMKEQGEIAANPFVESFTYPGNKKRIFIALFGVAAGLTVIWYTAMFSGLTFLKGPMRVEDTAAEIIVGISAAIGMAMFICFGKMSDRVGRKQPIIRGYLLTLLTLFPLFWIMGSVANPALSSAIEKSPIILVGQNCDYSPFASEQVSDCGKLMGDLSALGLPYEINEGDKLTLQIGQENSIITDMADKKGKERAALLTEKLQAAGYPMEKQIPSIQNILIIMLALLGLSALSAATYGPVAALLSEMFPPRVRYSSMSIPYHFGAGYFGGFLPLIAGYIVAKSGDPYAGLWYTMGIVLIAFIVASWGLKNGKPTDFTDD
ncbi:MFS transporter [Sphingorhabdus lutea]|uniref:MFS transporter n=1 Tax=Sphingorhabdus lutea TaxID=1913578 RepID=A0A1L3JC17_9SPHN|nr:MFS transporter [Sphingorhabdus lutea]APG62671.1 MFS transporter [Sphingorhabdus lutea]